MGMARNLGICIARIQEPFAGKRDATRQRSGQKKSKHSQRAYNITTLPDSEQDSGGDSNVGQSNVSETPNNGQEELSQPATRTRRARRDGRPPSRRRSTNVKNERRDQTANSKATSTPSASSTFFKVEYSAELMKMADKGAAFSSRSRTTTTKNRFFSKTTRHQQEKAVRFRNETGGRNA